MLSAAKHPNPRMVSLLWTGFFACLSQAGFAQNDRVAATTGFFALLRMTGKMLRMTERR